MSDTLVTVVIPTRNRAGYLRSAIESVLSQDYARVECIVIDAASTDGTIALLESYGERITWRSRPDRGAFDAINEGWRLGTGDVLAWVNSDDMLEEGAISTAVDYFAANPGIDVVYGACGAIDAGGKLFEQFPPRPWDLKLAVETCDHIIHQTAAFMRRGIIEQVGYLYPAWCHDHDLWLRIAIVGGRFGTTPRRLGLARIWPDNLGNNPAIIIEGKVGLTRRFFARTDLPAELRALEPRAMANAYLRCLYYVDPLRPRNWGTGLSLVRRAFQHDKGTAFGTLFAPRSGIVTLFVVVKTVNVLATAAKRLGLGKTPLGRAISRRLWPVADSPSDSTTPRP